jgi:hypothetical protein
MADLTCGRCGQMANFVGPRGDTMACSFCRKRYKAQSEVRLYEPKGLSAKVDSTQWVCVPSHASACELLNPLTISRPLPASPIRV